MQSNRATKGKSIVFSCTWYEKKKKVIAILNSASLKYLNFGLINTVIMEGRERPNVKIIENKSNVSY